MTHERRVPTRIFYQQDGIYLNYDIVKGQDYLAPYGYVVRGYFEAPNRGADAIRLLHQEIQKIADTFEINLSHLAEPDTASGKKFFLLSRQKHNQYLEEADLEGRRFFVQRFSPRTNI